MRKLVVIIFLMFVSSCFCFSQDTIKPKNVYTHAFGLNASFDLRWWQDQPRGGWLDLGGFDMLFSFSQNGLFNDGRSDGRKTLSPLWNLIPYYELGVNNIFFLKLEHFCTYRMVLRNTDPHSRNNSFYAHFRANVLHKIKNQRHKLLIGGVLGTNIYKEKRIGEKNYEYGFAPILTFGIIDVAYYYNVAGKFDVYFSFDHAMSIGETYYQGWRDFFSITYSLIRPSIGFQYKF